MVIGCSTELSSDDPKLSAELKTKFECAIGGAKNFATACSIERGEGTTMTVRHPDGGFRKVILKSNGAIDTADGAETVSVQPMADGRAQVSIGEDRYRLPAAL